jgi:DNA-binding CsgD family transcriptional regulator
VQRLYAAIDPYLFERAGLAVALDALVDEKNRAFSSLGRFATLQIVGETARIAALSGRLIFAVTSHALEHIANDCAAGKTRLPQLTLELHIKQAHALLQIHGKNRATLQAAHHALTADFIQRIEAAQGELWLNAANPVDIALNLLVPLEITPDSGFQNTVCGHDSTPLSQSISPPTLSDRERQVLLGIIHGLTMREISERLFLSKSSVETYRRRIYEKLDLKSKSELVAYAIRNQLFNERVIWEVAQQEKT